MSALQKRWLVAAGLVLLAFLTWEAWPLWFEPAVTQPVEFPHKAHLELKEQKLTCTSCHELADKGFAAGRPSTKKCLSCHSGAEAKSPAEKKVQAFGEKGQEIPWKRIWRLPSHVFFSHRTHVGARIECQTCHGRMETLERPPARPLKKLVMDDCIACHEKWRWPEEPKKRREPVERAMLRQVSVDCNACHR